MKIFAILVLIATCFGQTTYCPPRPRDLSGVYVCGREATTAWTKQCPFKKLDGTSITLYCKPLTAVAATATATKVLDEVCTYAKVTATACGTPANCASGVRPTYNLATHSTKPCCRSCLIPTATKIVRTDSTCPKPAVCTGTNKPTITTVNNKKCMSCRPDLSKFTKSQLANCKTSTTIPTCDPDERPTRDKTSGCPTCRFKSSSCGKRKDDSVEGNRKTKCASSWSSLPTCAGSTKPTFDFETCCMSCKIAPPAKLKATGKCTRDDIKKCVSAMPTCDMGQKPEKVDGKCCPSCVPAWRKCTFAERMKECKNVAQCDDDEQPAPVEGSCCPSCRPHKKPTCTTTCQTGKICARKKDDNKKATCVNSKVKTYNLKLNTTAVGSSTVDADDVRQMVLDKIERYCENPENDALCNGSKKLQAEAEGSLVVAVKKAYNAADGTIKVDISYASPGSSASRRLLQSGDVVEASQADTTTSDGTYSASADASFSGSAAATFSAMSVALPLVALFA